MIGVGSKGFKRCVVVFEGFESGRAFSGAFAKGSLMHIS